MKRFWSQARAAERGAGWAVLLDGRPVRLPGTGGPELWVPARALAQAIAAEWQQAGGAVGGEMTFADVPLTRLAGTAQDRIAPDPAATVQELARYAGSDLLCYRATGPEALVLLEQEAWQPWLDWAEARFGARLRAAPGIVFHAQDPAALARLARAVAACPPLVLAGLAVVVPALGSLVLGLAVAEGALDGAAAHALATVDERFQEQLWGKDAEATARRAAVAAEIATAARLIALARG